MRPLYGRDVWPVRDDIEAIHRQWLHHVASPGTWWTGVERVAMVEAVWGALDDPDPPPPWAPTAPVAGSPLPDAALAMATRLAHHAGTTTRDWYERTVQDLGRGSAAFVELAALAATATAVAAFGPALGLERPDLPAPLPGEPSRTGPTLVAAVNNWVPVAPPADERPAVVQAFTAVPAEWSMTWQLGATQYMPLEDMIHFDWRRPGSPLDRRQLELVAARVSVERECFY